jgi:hypothetical protein
MKEIRERELLDAELRRAAQEAHVESLWARRWPVLLAVASAVLLAFLLGLYVGWQQPLG